MFELNGNARLTMTMITCSVTISVTLHCITSQLAPKSRYESDANVQSLKIFKKTQCSSSANIVLELHLMGVKTGCNLLKVFMSDANLVTTAKLILALNYSE